MKNLDIVITMGGLGSRFRKAGYNVPKYMIKAKGKTLFEWSLISLNGFKDIAKQYIFIALKDRCCDVYQFISEQCEKLSIENYNVVLLDNLTDGQATTAMEAQQFWDQNDRLLIYNIDTYVESEVMHSAELRGDGFIPCFKASGDHWSFVRLDDYGRAVEVREKHRISDHCTLGAYFFSSCKLYADLYHQFYGSDFNTTVGEKYVAPLYNYLLSRGGDVYISDVDPKKVHVLGTPEELQAFLNESNQINF